MMGLPWATVYIVIAGYAIAKSTFGNFILLSILVSLLKVFYNWVLYPDFFTPIKKIPSPTVSLLFRSPILVAVRILMNGGVGTIVDHRQLRHSLSGGAL